MNTSSDNQNLQIPKTLQRQFQGLERRLWWVDTVIAICGALSGLLLSYTLVFVSDRFWDTPSFLRFLFAATGILVALWFLSGWFRHWIWQRRNYRKLSGIVQGHYRRLGDRLLGIVELADERKRPDNVSSALCQAAIRQVSQEAADIDFRQAVATRKPRLYALMAILVLTLVITPWVLVPEASWNALSRWLRPGASVARFTFVNLEALPDELVVAHGEPFEIACSVRLHPFWSPGWGQGRIEDQPLVKAPILGRQIVFAFPGQTAQGELVLKVGDIKRRMTIEPKLRPALKSMAAQLQYPRYLQYPEATIDLPKGMLNYLEGSRVSFSGTTTRALAQAGLELEFEKAADFPQAALKLTEDGFASDWISPVGAGQGVFTWEDAYGLTSSVPWRVTLRSNPDQAPEVACPEQAAVVAMLEEEILEIQTVGQDDFGIRELAMSWAWKNSQDTNIHAAGLEPIVSGAPESQQLSGVYRFSPTQLDIPADVMVSLRARAEDYFPDRTASESPVYRVYVLSYEEHARLLQQEFEKLMAELEDLTMHQEGLKAMGQEMQDNKATELNTESGERKLAAQAGQQNELAQKLSQLSERVAENLKEALRNKTIPTEDLQEWAQHAQTMQSLSAQQMSQASQALAMASQNPGTREEALSEALELEQEVLDALRQLQSEIGPALDRMLANTLAHRLRRVARKEAQIAKTLQSILPETIGLRLEKVPEGHRKTLQGLSAEQITARKDGGQLQTEISRFFDRTKEEAYGTVHQEMEEKGMAGKLLSLAGKIQNNMGTVSMMEAGEWETHFNGWADLLEKANQESGGGGGGSGGSMSEEALKRLLALLRLRQMQQNIRQHTQLLETKREKYQGYREDGIILSIRQLYLKEDTGTIAQMGANRFLPQVMDAMGESEGFLTTPQTDDPVVASQTDAVNLLEAEITDMLKSAQGSAMSAAMGMMMQMMGMGMAAGTGPGGSMAGGSTDDPGSELLGNLKGAPGLERRIDRTSGSSTRVVPVEFREAVQNFQRAMESIEINATSP